MLSEINKLYPKNSNLLLLLILFYFFFCILFTNFVRVLGSDLLKELFMHALVDKIKRFRIRNLSFILSGRLSVSEPSNSAFLSLA